MKYVKITLQWAGLVSAVALLGLAFFRLDARDKLRECQEAKERVASFTLCVKPGTGFCTITTDDIVRVRSDAAALLACRDD